ncbi:hypothetical protein V8F20_006148 [Naviculisporaceae sp. PSN 640]
MPGIFLRPRANAERPGRFPDELAAKYPLFARINKTLSILYEPGSFSSHINMAVVVKNLFKCPIRDGATNHDHISWKMMDLALKESEILFESAPHFQVHVRNNRKFPEISPGLLLAALCVEGGIPASWERSISWKNYKFLLYDFRDETTPDFWKGHRFHKSNEKWKQHFQRPPTDHTPRPTIPREILEIDVNAYFNNIPTLWERMNLNPGEPEFPYRNEISEPRQPGRRRLGNDLSASTSHVSPTNRGSHGDAHIPSIEVQEVKFKTEPLESPPWEPSIPIYTTSPRGSPRPVSPDEILVMKFKANPDLHNWTISLTETTYSEQVDNDPMIEEVLKKFDAKEEGKIKDAMLLAAQERLQKQTIPSVKDQLKQIKAAKENEAAIDEQLTALIEACKNKIASLTSHEKATKSRKRKMERFSKLVDGEVAKRARTSEGHGVHPATPMKGAGAHFVANDDGFNFDPVELQREEQARDREILWEYLGIVTDKQAFLYKAMLPIWNKLSRVQWSDYETYREAIRGYGARKAISEHTHELMWNTQYKARKDMGCFEVERAMPVFTVADYLGKPDKQ